MKILLALLLALPTLSACGGMNRAVTVVPNTLDDLGEKTKGFRQDRPAAETKAPAPTPEMR